MRRDRLLAEISERTGVPPETCREVVDGRTAVIAAGMRTGLSLRMVRFGTFAPMRLAAEGCLRGVALAAVLVAGPGVAPAWGQVPDNRGLALDPDDTLSPAYGRTLLEGDEQRLRDARERGGSFLPTAHGEVEESGREGVGGEETEVPDRTTPARPELVDERDPEPVYETYEAAPVESVAVPQMLDALIGAWNAPPAIVRVRYPRRDPAAGREDSADGEGRPGIDAVAAVPGLAAVRPGDGVYARAMYAIDSDYPGPVFLEVLEPPLAGARLTGVFTQVRERLVLRVSGIAYRGARAEIDGWAVGLDCACFGVGGAVDRHWFERVLLPAAVRFAEGFLLSAGRPEESVQIDGAGTVYERRRSTRRQDVMAGAAAAMGAAGEVLLEGAPTAPTVRIARDAEMVVVFARAGERTAARAEAPGG